MLAKQRVPKVKCRSVAVRSVSDFVGFVQDLQEEWSDWEQEDTKATDTGLAHIWFRGHSDVRWVLTPKLFRTTNSIGVQDEEEIITEFVRRGGSMMASQDPWHRYFQMQHHGVPTRLLDWTDSALVALFFALRTSKRDAAVWAVNPMWLNWKTINRYGLVSDPRFDADAIAFRFDTIKTLLTPSQTDVPLLSIAVRPPLVSPRMFWQRSFFTFHGARDLPIERYPFVNRETPLCRIVIPHNCRCEFMLGLRVCGMAEATIFPDLDGLARELIAEYGGLY